MKKSKFSDQQIALALQQAETETSVADVCRKLGISEATFYRWKDRYGGLTPPEVRKLKHLEEENARLRRRLPRRFLMSTNQAARWSRSAIFAEI